MRSVIASFSIALVTFVAAPTLAQTPPADSVTQVLRQTAAAGKTADYEAGRKKHMAWHKSQGDTWAWNTYEVLTGPQSGAYVIASGNHQWAEIDAWNAKMGEGDTADAQASMGGSRGGSEMSYWTQLNSISRLPEDTKPAPLLSLTFFAIKPGHEAALMTAIGKINVALSAAKYPVHSIWYRLTSGGAMPTYAVVAPRANYATFDNAVFPALEKHLGKPATAALSKEFYDNVTGVTSELLQHRADLSYMPN